MEAFTSFLYFFDLFAITPGARFTFKKSKLFSSIYGKVASLIVYGLVLTATYYFSQNFLYKTRGQITTSEILTPNPEAFPLNKDTFFFAFALQNSSNNYLAFIDEGIYTIEVRLRTKISNNFTIQPISIGECDESDYPMNPDLRSYFDSNSIKGYYCIKNWTELELLGYWDSPLFKELEFFVRPCRNGTGDVICKTKEEMEIIFDDGYFGSFLSTGVVDPGNYDRPIEYTPMNFYTRVSLKTYVFIEMSLQHNEIQTDSGNLMEDIHIEKGISKTNERQSVTIDPKDVIFELWIRLDRIKKVFTRKYDKIQNVLANVGGIFNVLILMGTILLRKIVEFSFAIEVSENIFDIKGSKDFQNKHNNSENTSPVSNINRKSIKPNQYNGIWNKYYNIWKKKWNILCIAKNQIDIKMDISFIIKKLLELEKLKYLIFDKEQLYLFDLIPKPKLVNKKDGEIEESIKEINKLMISKQSTTCFTEAKGIKLAHNIENFLAKKEKSKFDERLINLLRDSNIINFKTINLEILQNDKGENKKKDKNRSKSQTKLSIPVMKEHHNNI